LDGERIDQVTGTAKPEIFLREGILFATSEKHFRSKELHAEILELSETQGSLGRVVTARSISPGRILLSGPSTSCALKEWMENVKLKYRADLCIVDGALSRMSQASPAVTTSVILTTGAALSLNINNLVYKTAFVVNLIKLPETKRCLSEDDLGGGREIWLLKGDNRLCKIYTPGESSPVEKENLERADGIFVGGALTENILRRISGDFKERDIEVVIRDFTRLFASEREVYHFLRNTGHISVLQKTRLVAICVNPVAPNGSVLDSDRLCSELSAATSFPVYDILKSGYEN
ncbi:MAG: hypothetical protein PHT63_07820, partial [Bacteroidales bacterium]|nr:hypothetical protein [Bacteroidales bacterium]